MAISIDTVKDTITLMIMDNAIAAVLSLLIAFPFLVTRRIGYRIRLDQLAAPAATVGLACLYAIRRREDRCHSAPPSSSITAW